jgi:hypothetical protein
MPEVCLQLYHYASSCRRSTGKVELKSTFPAYRRCSRAVALEAIGEQMFT